MSDVLLKILEMSLMGSVVILVTILMRLFLKKNSKKYVMILWAIVALRLLVPVSFESALSIFNYIPHKVTEITAVSDKIGAPVSATQMSTATTSIAPEAVDKVAPNVPGTPDAPIAPETNQTDVKPVTEAKADSPVNEAGKTESQAVSKAEVSKTESAATKIVEAEVETSKSISLANVLGIVYGVGVVGILGYCVISYVMLKRRIKDATEIEKNVYESEKVNSPFVLGFIEPKIYLPDVLEKDEREYILLHERTHIKHRDWISKLVGMAVVAVHWFNPIVWIGYALFEQDIEMLCDEDTVAKMDNELKKAYTMSIVTYAKKSSGKVYLVAPLSFSKPNFGKKEVTNRVKNIINYRKGTKITAILTTIVVFGVSTACALNSTTESKETTAASANTVITETTKLNAASESNEADDVSGDSSEVVETSKTGIKVNKQTYYYKYMLDKAAELHSEDEDNSLIYGTIDVSFLFSPEDWKLFVYDTATGDYTSYAYSAYSKAYVETYHEPIYEDMSTTDPTTWLMTYDDFVAFPGVIANDLMHSAYETTYNKDTYHSVIPDGIYLGSVYGWSEDLKNTYVNLTPLSDDIYISEDVSNLKPGDTLNIQGNDIVLGPDTYVESYFFDWMKTGSEERLMIMNYEPRDINDYTFAEVPLADGAKITICDQSNYEVVTVTKDELYDYFESMNQRMQDMGIFEGYGISFCFGANAEYVNSPIVVENGEIVEMTIGIFPFSTEIFN